MRASWLRRRPLRALQVEPTSRCTHCCAICPRSALAQSWQEGDLTPRVWARLREGLGLAEYVHLQGWGEPLLDDRLAERVRDARACGCRVGLTTNGTLLATAADWIVAEGVDLVTVSLAGGPATHAHLRGGSSLDVIWDGIRRLAARRRDRGRPRILASYLLTCDNFAELADTVASAAAGGVDEVFVTHIDCHPSRALRERAVFGDAGLHPGVAEAVERAARVARARGVAFRPPPLEPSELLVCALNPLRFAFVAWDGRVGPCVNLLFPISGAIPREGQAGSWAVEPVVFGELGQRSLQEILEGAARRLFAEAFEARLAAERRFLAGLGGEWGHSAQRQLEELDERRSTELACNPFPAACRSCPKAKGW